MMAEGFLDEVRALREAGYGAARAMQGLGYKQLGQHLDGACSLEDAVAAIGPATAGYARRQRTWFRREEIDLRAGQPLHPPILADLVDGTFRARLRLPPAGRMMG
jgi:tRNA A37 N6-isopentenylltransferase MiaA